MYRSFHVRNRFVSAVNLEDHTTSVAIDIFYAVT